MILGKAGITGVEFNLGTVIRTGVVLVMAVIGRLRDVRAVPCGEFDFGSASGALTCASWLCYYWALQGDPTGVEAAIGKLNFVVTVLFVIIPFGSLRESWFVAVE